ncbi:peptidase activity [Sparganum proliferum]
MTDSNPTRGPLHGVRTKLDVSVINGRVPVLQVRNIRLQVGEEAYILPGTRVVVKCPVKHFSTANIVWKHFQRGEFLYEGRTRADTYVTKSGRLVIRSFNAADKGEWKCYAGDKSAGITLHYNQPSTGYYDWERRNSMRNTDMLNEDPAVIMTKQVHVQTTVATPDSRLRNV